MPEARLEDSGSGLAPTSEGWFVVNARDAMWVTSEPSGPASLKPSGAESVFETPMNEFAQLGVRIHVLTPGEPNGAYHSESMQEDFLVLAGECTLLVQGEERTLRQWDFFHAPPGTEHVFVGAGDGPCAIFMVGARGPGMSITYPVSELAARYDASAPKKTNDPDEVYMGRYEPSRRERPSTWHDLPWGD